MPKSVVPIMWVVLFLVPLTGASIDIYAPSLPAMELFFATSRSLIQLSVAIYLFGYCFSQLGYGILTDRYGRKPVLLAGLLFYVISSFLIPFQHQVSWLLLLRFLQGIAVGSPGVITKSIITDCFTGEALHKNANYLTISWAIGAILSPVIGGYLQHYFDWHAPFYFLIIYGFIGFLLTLFIPETHAKENATPWREVVVIYRGILSHRVFLAVIMGLGLIYGFIVIFNVMGPFLIQTVLQYSPIVYGHMALLLGLMWMLGNISNRLLLRWMSRSLIMHITLFLALAMTIILMLIAQQGIFNLLWLMWPLLLLFYFSAFLYPNFMGIALSLFPNAAGRAAAMLGTLNIFIAAAMGGVGSLLQTKNQLSLAWIYLLLLIITGLFFWFSVRPVFKPHQH